MPENTKIVIIDDEHDSVESLKIMLKKTSFDLEIVGEAYNVKSGLEVIFDKSPHLVLLDILMPDGTGFDLLNFIEHKNFEVIFITAYDEFAIKAFEFSAIHYLLKPIDQDDLNEAIDRFRTLRNNGSFDQKFKVLNELNKYQFKTIVLQDMDKIHAIPIADIVRLEAADHYTIFYTNNGNKIISGKTLNNYDDLFSQYQFSRVHKKHIVNLKYVSKYIKGAGGEVLLEDGSLIEVSMRKKSQFLEELKKFTS